jgi:flagellar basal-body rod protein FlgG
MIGALYTAASGMNAQQLNVDTVSNNLANVNTTGYKRQRAEFQDLLYAQLSSPDTKAPLTIQVGHGVRTSAMQRMFDSGPIMPTGNDLDLAIDGNGFFRVKARGGAEFFTRDGAFRLDGFGRLVTSNGYIVQGDAGAIQVPPDAQKISIAEDGTVEYVDPVTGSRNVAGVISLASFPNPAGLEAIGQNMFAQTTASGEASKGQPGSANLGIIRQGALEGSNVEVVQEMVNLIVAQRAYEISSKAVQSADEMAGMANNVRR